MPTLALAADPADLEETRRQLTSRAHRRFGAIPADLIVDHVLAMTVGADFPVREAALEALLRRGGFGLRDALLVASRPTGTLGAYTTRRGGRRGRERPYASWVDGLRPLAGSCDCSDYLRSSLGLCKHLLAIFDDIHRQPRRLKVGLRELTVLGTPRRRRLTWDARLPLLGELDRLAGLRLQGAATPAEVLANPIARAFRTGALEARLLADGPRRLDCLRMLRAAIQDRGRHSLEASPAARALIDEELARATRRADCLERARGFASQLSGLKRKLYPYQRAGVLRFFESGRLLLADDMGLGKTTQAIASCHALFRAGAVKRGLLIVPASLKSQWLREWQETTDTPARVVEGSPAERARTYQGLRAGFLILGYEQLLRDAALVRALDPQLVVLDEAQRIKNYATRSAAEVKALTPAYRLVLTGTPMENRLAELSSILDWVDDLALAPKWRLDPWYGEWEGDGGKGKSGARHLDTLRTRIAGCMLRRVRKDVLAQLPSRSDTRVPVEMTEQQRLAHDELIPPIAALSQIAKKRPLLQAEFLRLMQLLTHQRVISNGLGQLRFEELWPTYASARPDAALLEGLFAPKLAEFRRLVSDVAIGQERKIVVFSQWRRMLRLAEWSIRDLLEAAGLRAVFFTGAEREAQRTRAIVELHDDPRVRVMFLSDAGGVGLNLQRAASCCVNLELPWNPAVLEQRIGRIHRLGQKRPIDVYNLVNEYGIESRIASILGAKKALFSGLFDGTTDGVKFDGATSFMARVKELVETPAEEMPAPSARAGEALADEVDAEAAGEELPSEESLAPERSEARADEATRLTHPVSDARPLGVSELFAQLRVERTADGGLRLEAPPEAANALAALFEGMGRLVRASP